MGMVVDAGYACKLEHAISAKLCFVTNATTFVPGSWSKPSLQTAALSLADTQAKQCACCYAGSRSGNQFS